MQQLIRSFGEVGPAAGAILLSVLLLWTGMVALMYWALTTRSASFDEAVKYAVLRDDPPIAPPQRRWTR